MTGKAKSEDFVEHFSNDFIFKSQFQLQIHDQNNFTLEALKKHFMLRF